MSAQLRSRALQEGRIKTLRRLKQPMTRVLETSTGVRDPVARALGQRGMRGAGQHIQSRGAQRRADRHEYRHDHRHGPQVRYYQARGPQFQRGRYIPVEYRSRQYVVVNPHQHRLYAPPRGQQWVQVGSDYVLVAVATGLIVNLLLNN